jgi:hypothetical protein
MGLFDTVSSLAEGASPVTNLIPGGAGVNLAISTVSKLKNFLSGKGGAPDHERPDIISISNATGLTQQQVSDLCGMEEKRSPDNYDDIVKKYANNPGAMLSLVHEWNDNNPSKKIVPLEEIPSYMPTQVQQSPVSKTTVVPAQLVQTTSTSTPVIANGFNGTDLKDLGTAILKGAQGGATDWGMNTPAGKQAKKDGFNSWLKDNQLPVAGFGLFVLFLIYKAFIYKK